MHPLRFSTLVFGFAPAVAAQERPDTAVLAPITVTASRAVTPQSVSTAGSTVLLGSALRARGITTVAAALREVPSAALVRAGTPGSEASLYFRGGESNHVLVMIDGVTVNEPGGSFNFGNLTLDDVDRIEVVRGPASVLYGADAMTGVIQIFTRAPAQPRRGELRAQIGQLDGRDVEASLTGGRAGATFAVGGGDHRSRGIHTFNNDWRSSSATGSLRLGGRGLGTTTVNARYADARYDYPTEFSGDPLDSNSYYTERRLSAGITSAHSVTPRVDLHISAGASRYQSITDDAAERPDDFADHFEARSLRRNVDARLDFRPTPRATLSVGADFDWQRSEGSGQDPEADAIFRRWSRGGFAQLIGDVARRWTYSLGARVENNQRFGTFTSLRSGAGVRLSRTTTLRAAAGTAFKEPTFTELSGGGFAKPNEELEPERSASWEVGVEQRVGGAVVVAATYFDQEFRDLIQFVPISDPDFFAQYRNAQSGYASGWELEARAGVVGRATLRASLTILDPTIRGTGATPSARLPRRPNRSASIVLAVPTAAGLMLHTDIAFTGRRDDLLFDYDDGSATAVRMPSYTVVGLGATYAPPRSPTRLGRGTAPVEVMARVDNLFDTDYQAIAGFATPRRTASAGVRIGFGW